MMHSISSLCIYIFILLISDAVTLKLVPGERSVVKDNGITHTISKYYLVPDDLTFASNGSLSVNATEQEYTKNKDGDAFVRGELLHNINESAIIFNNKSSGFKSFKTIKANGSASSYSGLASSKTSLRLGAELADSDLGNFAVEPLSTTNETKYVTNDINFKDDNEFVIKKTQPTDIPIDFTSKTQNVTNKTNFSDDNEIMITKTQPFKIPIDFLSNTKNVTNEINLREYNEFEFNKTQLTGNPVDFLNENNVTNEIYFRENNKYVIDKTQPTGTSTDLLNENNNNVLNEVNLRDDNHFVINEAQTTDTSIDFMSDTKNVTNEIKFREDNEVVMNKTQPTGIPIDLLLTDKYLTDFQNLVNDLSDINKERFWKVWKIYVGEPDRNEYSMKIKKMLLLLSIFTSLNQAIQLDKPIDDIIDDLIYVLEGEDFVTSRYEDGSQTKPLVVEEKDPELKSECLRKCLQKDSRDFPISETDDDDDRDTSDDLELETNNKGYMVNRPDPRQSIKIDYSTFVNPTTLEPEKENQWNSIASLPNSSHENFLLDVLDLEESENNNKSLSDKYNYSSPLLSQDYTTLASPNDLPVLEKLKLTRLPYTIQHRFDSDQPDWYVEDKIPNGATIKNRFSEDVPDWHIDDRIPEGPTLKKRFGNEQPDLYIEDRIFSDPIVKNKLNYDKPDWNIEDRIPNGPPVKNRFNNDQLDWHIEDRIPDGPTVKNRLHNDQVDWHIEDIIPSGPTILNKLNNDQPDWHIEDKIPDGPSVKNRLDNDQLDWHIEDRIPSGPTILNKLNNDQTDWHIEDKFPNGPTLRNRFNKNTPDWYIENKFPAGPTVQDRFNKDVPDWYIEDRISDGPTVKNRFNKDTPDWYIEDRISGDPIVKNRFFKSTPDWYIEDRIRDGPIVKNKFNNNSPDWYIDNRLRDGFPIEHPDINYKPNWHIEDRVYKSPVTGYYKKITYKHKISKPRVYTYIISPAKYWYTIPGAKSNTFHIKSGKYKTEIPEGYDISTLYDNNIGSNAEISLQQEPSLEISNVPSNSKLLINTEQNIDLPEYNAEFDVNNPVPQIPTSLDYEENNIDATVLPNTIEPYAKDEIQLQKVSPVISEIAELDKPYATLSSIPETKLIPEFPNIDDSEKLPTLTGDFPSFFPNTPLQKYHHLNHHIQLEHIHSSVEEPGLETDSTYPLPNTPSYEPKYEELNEPNLSFRPSHEFESSVYFNSPIQETNSVLSPVDPVELTELIEVNPSIPPNNPPQKYHQHIPSEVIHIRPDHIPESTFPLFDTPFMSELEELNKPNLLFRPTPEYETNVYNNEPVHQTNLVQIHENLHPEFSNNDKSYELPQLTVVNPTSFSNILPQKYHQHHIQSEVIHIRPDFIPESTYQLPNTPFEPEYEEINEPYLSFRPSLDYEPSVYPNSPIQETNSFLSPVEPVELTELTEVNPTIFPDSPHQKYHRHIQSEVIHVRPDHIPGLTFPILNTPFEAEAEQLNKPNLLYRPTPEYETNVYSNAPVHQTNLVQIYENLYPEFPNNDKPDELPQLANPTSLPHIPLQKYQHIHSEVIHKRPDYKPELAFPIAETPPDTPFKPETEELNQPNLLFSPSPDYEHNVVYSNSPVPNTNVVPIQENLYPEFPNNDKPDVLAQIIKDKPTSFPNIPYHQYHIQSENINKRPEHITEFTYPIPNTLSFNPANEELNKPGLPYENSPEYEPNFYLNLPTQETKLLNLKKDYILNLHPILPTLETEYITHNNLPSNNWDLSPNLAEPQPELPYTLISKPTTQPEVDLTPPLVEIPATSEPLNLINEYTWPKFNDFHTVPEYESINEYHGPRFNGGQKPFFIHGFQNHQPSYSYVNYWKTKLAPSYHLFTKENLVKVHEALLQGKDFNINNIDNDRALINLRKIINTLLILAQQTPENENNWYENILLNAENHRSPLKIYVYNLLRQKWLHELMLQLIKNNNDLSLLDNPKILSFLGAWQFPNDIQKHLKPEENLENDELERLIKEITNVHINKEPLDTEDEYYNVPLPSNEGIILSITGLDVGLDATAIVHILKKYMLYRTFVEKQENIINHGNEIEMFKQIILFLKEKGYRHDIIADLVHKLYGAVYSEGTGKCSQKTFHKFVKKAYDVIVPVLRRSMT